MSKFKVGDKVIANKNAPYIITTNGWVGEVISIGVNGNFAAIDGGDKFFLEDEYFDLVSNQKIVITTDGTKTVTAKVYDGKKVIKTAEAKCSPEDKFDFDYGAALAVERLTGQILGNVENTIEEKPKELLKDGVFGKSKYGWFVVIGDKFVCENGGFNRVSEYDGNLRAFCDKIECLVEAVSFDNAKACYENGYGVIWKR